MKRAVLTTISFYQKIISPLLVGFMGHGCRFNPTCSEYARRVISRHGLGKGSKMALARLSRCHPFSKHAATPTG